MTVAWFLAALTGAVCLTIAFVDGIRRRSLDARLVLAVVNFPPKQIANFLSECLVLGVYTDKKEVVLLAPDRKVENGWKIG